MKPPSGRGGLQSVTHPVYAVENVTPAPIRIRVQPVTQGGYDFFVGAHSAKELLSIAYVQVREEGEGVQRILSSQRLKEIASYVRSDSKPGLLPNAIILALKKGARFTEKTGELVIPAEPEQAFVVDGQHRLFAFQEKYAGDFDMALPFSAFVDLPIEEVAYLFRVINSTQRKINPSLVYDLVPYLRRRDWVDFEDSRAQFLVQQLAEDESSPWFRAVSMLGGRDQPITQASFVTAVKRLLKRGQVFNKAFMEGAFFGQEVQYELLLAYFKAIRNEFDSEWLNANYVISKNLGVSAFLNVLGEIMLRMARRRQLFDEEELLVTAKDFATHIRRLKKGRSWHRVEMGKTHLGAAGIRSLTDELRSALG